jgi:ribonuclease HI
MGIGWVQVDNNSILHTFQAQVKLWPCSFKSELTAILSALVTTPRNCTVNIYTDSQSVISKYQTLLNSSTTLSYTHTPYFLLWNTLVNFINSYKIRIIFHKVTAHQDDTYNNLADQLARNHYNLPYLTFMPYNIYNPAYTLILENFSLELPTRRSIRTICHAHIYALWITQNRFLKWEKILNQINWQATWLYINNNQKISNFSHSFQSSTLKSFRIKILLDELPAPHTLHKCYHSYPPICHQCQHISSHLHWTTCPSDQLLNNLINESLQHTLNITTLNTTSEIITNLHHQIKQLNCMSSHSIPDLPSILSTLSGLVPNEIITIVADLSSTKISITLITKFLLHLNQQIYHKIWIPYCISRSTIHLPISNLSFNSPSQLVQTPSLNTISSKINSWYIQWIKYQTNLSHIITNTQI